MTFISKVDDHGLETLKKAGVIPDDANITEYALRIVPIDSEGRQFSTTPRDDGKVTLDTIWQDPTTPPFDFYFSQAKGAPTALTLSPAINDYTITVDDSTLFLVGDYIGVFSGSSNEGRFFFANILSKVDDTLTLDTPLDFSFDIGDPVISTTRDLEVDGSITPQIFRIAGGASPDSPVTIDITRIMIKIICLAAPEFSEFGDIEGGLARGIVLRRVNGTTQNYFNLKTNGEMAHIMFDFNLFDQTRQQGVNGLTGRLTYAGPSKHGTAIRLDPGDALEMIVQDDLTSLVSFRVIATGHIVD